ncbi:MAG TPA: 4Fe-4S dicluster domain-containing protein [Desulfobacterales bacterium]|nr:4Fe-4S dicluster domain-containing protein [Desulfobacterales bacterium]
MKALITTYDILLIATAIMIMAAGLAKRWSLWRALKQEDKASGDWPGLINYFLKHKEILRRPWVGISHLILFWGVMLPMAVVILAQFGFAIPEAPAHILSLLQDLAGFALLAGTLFLFIRRILSGDRDGPLKTLFPMVILMIIIVSGFLAEGTRLSILRPDDGAFVWFSPLGWVLSFGVPASPLFMQMMIRVHFLSVLIFIAAIPFTFMRHLAVAPLNVYYKKHRAGPALRDIAPEKGQIGAGTVEDFSWKQLLDVESCVSCGRCEEHCPAFISGKPLSPRKVIRTILKQAERVSCDRRKQQQVSVPPLLEKDITKDEIWACTTCMACVTQCPVFIEPLDKIIDMRRYQVMGQGCPPVEAHHILRDLELYGDVQGKGIAHRADWALNRNVTRMSEPDANADILFWVGCSGAFHPRNQETSRAMAKILKAAGVRFGVLAQKELCCGDPARRLGEETLFSSLAKKNIACFSKYQVRKIVTLCPHCLNTLKNEYPQLGCDIPVVHATEFVMELIREKRIIPKYPVAEKMAVHDACYLGRYNQIYQPPREICQSVPGTQLMELERNCENSFCCGGGGGRMWLHENIGRNINLLRAEEIAKSEIGLIGTACPFCLVMLDDGLKSLETENPPKVADIIDIVADSLGYAV